MNKLTQGLVALGLLGAGVAGFAALNGLSSTAESSPPEPAPLTVEVVTVTSQAHQATLHATGTVQASTRVDLVPEVAGRVVSIADGLTPGARFPANTTIAQLDRRDYRAAVTQAQAQVAQAELALAQEEGRARQAVREAELLGQDLDNPLTRREPQLASARANLASAEAGLERARLNLSRTRLSVPFPSIVSSESLEAGQYVAPGAPVATVFGTERFRVRVSLPVHEMAWLEVPGFGSEEGSTADVVQTLADGGVLKAPGRVLRGLGELDAQTRTAGLIVAIDDPLESTEGEVPILPGAYVDVTLHGRRVPDTFEVPRVAVVGGDAVWLASDDDTLTRRAIRIGWGEPDHVYVTGGLSDGDRIVVTPMALPIEGMPLDVQDAVATTADGAAEAAPDASAQ